jgi:hypothetical protein
MDELLLLPENDGLTLPSLYSPLYVDEVDGKQP